LLAHAHVISKDPSDCKRWLLTPPSRPARAALHACWCFRGWLLCRGKTGLVHCMKQGFDSVHERPCITARWLLALRHCSQPASSPLIWQPAVLALAGNASRDSQLLPGQPAGAQHPLAQPAPTKAASCAGVSSSHESALAENSLSALAEAGLFACSPSARTRRRRAKPRLTKMHD